MIEVIKHILPNGLKLIIHQDFSTPIASVNLLYDVGSKDEGPNKTGFAHLFEHLMFGGSVNIPLFDEPLEHVGGENNAFTNNDITNYYITLPVENIETAFWLESDRMQSLAFSKKSLDVQRNVVIEEFNQRYLNQPYGDVWLHLRPLAYTAHPYMWPTIGKSTDHIKSATLSDVKDFFYSHYAPNNAILCVAGPVDPAKIINLANKWFGPIEQRNIAKRNLPKEPIQTAPRELEVVRDVPFNSIYKAYHMYNRHHKDFPAIDLMSDLLSNGKSARLYQKLVKEKQLFSNVNAYITGDIEEGLFIITGQLYPTTTYKQAESAIAEEVLNLQEYAVSNYELEKVQNKFESNFTFEETSALNKATNLSFFELLGDANNVNLEVQKYRNITPENIRSVAQEILTENNCSTLYYTSNQK
ncbi:MAG: M16 family metallopeptidase [Bacteroidales bacterium]